ncbi:MAG TPA: hypothetical protein VIV11_42805 [Kofleriaceae bacterium]
MRILLASTLLVGACASNPPAGGEQYDSVRDRLSDGQTRMFVGSEGSSGNITARRWTQSGWVEGVTPVTIDGGELSAKVDAAGTLKLDTFVVELAPIDIPEEVFKKPAQLDDVQVSLREPTSVQLAWTSDDDATATVTLALDFDWAIRVNGGKTPLGTQHLPPVMVDVALTGAGDHIDASISLAATGELWSWAGLLEMTSIELSLAAGTVD